MEEFENASFAFAEVWLPLALNKSLTYVYKETDNLQPGIRVTVPLKGKRLYTAFVWKTGLEKPDGYEPKQILDVLDESPYLDPVRIQMFEWMASYYCTSIGEILLAAIPSGDRLSSESFLHLHPDFDWKTGQWSSEQEWLFRFLDKKKKIALAEAAKALGPGKNWMKWARELEIEKQILILDEMSPPIRIRAQNRIVLEDSYANETALDLLFSQFENSPEEEKFLLKFLSDSRYSPDSQQIWSVEKDNFLKSEAEKKVFQRLRKRGVFRLEKVSIQPFQELSKSDIEAINLSNAQHEAYLSIQEGLNIGKIALLMGITGSGKTEIYIRLIQDQIIPGGQCLLLLPEIAITVQIVNRLRKVFGSKLGVYHSKANPHEKMAVWEGIRTGSLKIVVGVRSAVFLPFTNLGLVIIDEEHDSSYKQNEPSPRYHGRDAAIYLGSIWKAKILLGSATPSVESYFKAKSGKWHLVLLNERFGQSVLPDIRFVDMRKAKRMQEIKLDISDEILNQFLEMNKNGKQSILFQNRRGYAPYVECQDCGWIPYCPSCDVSLTLHQAKKSLNCHYCGHQTDVPQSCIECGSVHFEAQGYGTEKLEESLEHLLPGFRIARMDQDTTQSRKSYEQILGRMASGDIDILVGTQMVTKGLDFEKVGFVAVFDIDRVLHYPEFRANERTFQLLKQISGRAGRRTEKGLVLVQTQVPYHPVFSMVAKDETELFYEMEIGHRKEFGYPPFTRLVRITSRHAEKEQAEQAARVLSKELLKALGSEMVLGPEAPPIARLRNQFIFHILIKIPDSVSLSGIKTILKANLFWVESLKEYRKVQWIMDVDPN
jgi:primosomal protein N' (replication factor Y)